MRKNTRGFAGALHRANDVQEVSVVPLLLGRYTPSESLVAIERRREAGGPGLVGEGRIGYDVIIGAELFAVFELGIEQSVSGEDVSRREVMQDHVHAGETGGRHVF